MGEGLSAQQPEPNRLPSAERRTHPAKVPPCEIVPLLRQEVRVFDLDVGVRAILDSLRRGEGLPWPSAGRVTVATRAGMDSATDILELAPLSASFLKLCDGRTLDRIAAHLDVDVELESIGREQVATLAFQELCSQGLLTWWLPSIAGC